MYSDKSWATRSSPNTGWQGPYPFSQPTYVPEPYFTPNIYTPYYAGRVMNRNQVIGDHLQFGEQWSMLLGVTRSNIRTVALDGEGAKSQPD